MRDGSVNSYSNAVAVTVPVPPPPASLALSGGRDPVMINTVNLSWTSTGLSGVDHWVVTRSEVGGTGVSWNVPYSGSSGSYADTSASGTLSYTYRVAAMSGGNVVRNSNTITIPIAP